MPTSWALNSTSHYKTIIEECSSLDCFDTEEYNDSMAYGPALWTFLPDTFRNTSLFHVGNGEFGIKTGALILLPIQFFAFIPATQQEEIHTEDPEERAKLEEERTRQNTIRQVFTTLFLALIIWVIMGLAALML